LSALDPRGMKPSGVISDAFQAVIIAGVPGFDVRSDDK
jgi:hypothetical protein